MDEDADPPERQEGPRDQEWLLRLARLPLAGRAASLAPRLARDGRGIRFAVTPGIEHVLSVSADDAAAAGETAQEWQARHAAWVNVGPCETVVPHPDAPDRLTQAVANLHDVGLWPWVWGGDTDEARS